MFERFSDKQGLSPFEIPAEDKMLKFAESNSFDNVAFILLDAPTIKSYGLKWEQWEKVKVTIGARTMVFNSHNREKTADVQTAQTSELYERDTAIKASFEKCVNFLRERI